MLGSPPRSSAPAPSSPGTPGGIEVTAAKRSILSHLERIALLDGGDAAVAEGKHLLETRPGDYVMDENTMNNTAYALLGIEHPGEALPLFEWNAQRFPQSANVLDSLGDAQYTAGDRMKALASFKRAVQLDPKGPASAASAAMVKRISEL